ncbi:MAG: hypothetical protein HC872_09445 [Gammaproteobacteria bacterium]|nr:hypothetical protein [Gammaproteobacteria bacterium]
MTAWLSRRDLMFGSAASALAFLLPAAPARAATWKRYAQVIAVDGLGSPGGDGSEPDAPSARRKSRTCAPPG